MQAGMALLQYSKKEIFMYELRANHNNQWPFSISIQLLSGSNIAESYALIAEATLKKQFILK
jgi:hypothetical protein